MSLRIGDDAPDFTAQTTEGEINFHEWLGNSWGIIYSNYSVATPVDWEVGQDVIISPAVKQEDVEAKFPKGHQLIKTYLRYTPQPNIK